MGLPRKVTCQRPYNVFRFSTQLLPQISFQLHSTNKDLLLRFKYIFPIIKMFPHGVYNIQMLFQDYYLKIFHRSLKVLFLVFRAPKKGIFRQWSGLNQPSLLWSDFQLRNFFLRLSQASQNFLVRLVEYVFSLVFPPLLCMQLGSHEYSLFVFYKIIFIFS